MKTLLTILLATLFAVSANGQTIRTLGFNTTNGQIVAATNVVWTNSFTFSTNAVAAQVRTNLNLGWSALTNTNSGGFYAATLTAYNLIQPAMQEDNNEARNDLGLPLAALTNTSNVTIMRALSGSTNASHPFSGSFVFVDDASNTWSATVSNGIIQLIVEQ